MGRRVEEVLEVVSAIGERIDAFCFCLLFPEMTFFRAVKKKEKSVAFWIPFSFPSEAENGSFCVFHCDSRRRPLVLLDFSLPFDRLSFNFPHRL